MRIPDEKTQQIDDFIDEFLSFLDSKAEFVYYKNPSKHKPGSGIIEAFYKKNV
jgi:hypothetical protein